MPIAIGGAVPDLVDIMISQSARFATVLLEKLARSDAALAYTVFRGNAIVREPLVPLVGQTILAAAFSCYCELMGVAVALDDLLESLTHCLDAESARRVIGMQVASHVRERIDQLAHAANEGALNESDRSEYEALINAADIISILKLKAQNLLQINPA